jgi:esterase/lipase
MKELTQDKNFNGHRISTAFHDVDSKSIVIFLHGYRGTNAGPNRFFVTAARQLAKQGISSLRFDQYGSGNSEGDFFDASFIDWIKTTKAIAENHLNQGYKVALFGQSMGGAAVIAVGSELPNLSAIVAWSPDPNVEKFVAPKNGIIEESGQIVQARFWQEAHDVKVAKNAQSNHKVENFEGYAHSKWTYEQAKEIIDKSIKFLVEYLGN